MATSNPHLIQVTLGSGNTQITTANTYCRWFSVQNNAAHSVRLGDSTVSSTKGMLIASGTPGGAITKFIGAAPGADTDLSTIYLNGTLNDVIDVLYFD